MNMLIECGCRIVNLRLSSSCVRHADMMQRFIHGSKVVP